ncbi:MAG TPA: hypothetical protein VKJ83_08290, partial [Actinomycetota bacterium]|nr:hypothetical protein [Actinomycetota bacterium]
VPVATLLCVNTSHNGRFSHKEAQLPNEVTVGGRAIRIDFAWVKKRVGLAPGPGLEPGTY